MRADDAGLELEAENENIKEIKELQEASIILNNIVVYIRQKSQLFKSDKTDGLVNDKSVDEYQQKVEEKIGQASLLVADARKHHKKLINLSSRIWRDLCSLRGGNNDKIFLKISEKRILDNSMALMTHLNKAGSELHSAQNELQKKNFKKVYRYLRAGLKIVQRIIKTMIDLYTLEKQLETSLRTA